MTESLIGFAILLLMVFLGFPLGFAMVAVGFVGFGLVRGWEPALETVGQLILDFAMSYSFSVLPLFVLMGAFVYRAALSEDLYDASNAWLGHYKGGLAMATVAACGGFSAVSGSSVATAATMAKVAMPSMRRYRYNENLAAGTIAAGGTMGILIPPSIALVIYGIIVEEDVGKLFIAGIVPGIITVALYIFVIKVLITFRPSLGPRGPWTPWKDRFLALKGVWGMIVLFLLVLGGIYLGVFTPTEAAAIGAAGAMLFALGRRKLALASMIDALIDAGRTTAMIFMVGFGALVFSNFINLAGLPDAMVELIHAFDVPVIGVVLIICAIYVVLGCVFDSLAMLLLTVPVFFPIVDSLGVDPIWFGIVIIIVVEIGLITPPIGMNVFMVKTVLRDVEIWTIFNGVWPFLAATLIGLALILVFPDIALLLPDLMPNLR